MRPCKKKNRFVNQGPDICEIIRIMAAMAICYAVTGTLAYWFFTTWAKQLGIIFTIG